MNYDSQVPAGHGIARSGVSPKTADKPRLAQQLEQLSKVLSSCHLGAGEIENAADRILGPVPQDVSKAEPTPPTETIERKFAELIGYAESLSARLQHASSRLNSAV